MRTIQKVAVLGAGTMGARIAAHFANAGIPSVLLDIVLPNQPNRNAAALKGIENAAKQRPGGFFITEAASLITPGNFEDDLAKVADCDWIIEAVAENLEIKRGLWGKVEKLRKPNAIVSTNTSGIPLHKIAEGFSDSFRHHFLGTHFFNPPRYMHLVELIPLADTSHDVMDFVSHFCERRLGKGVVPCKDTPNFIANRIGSFFGATVQKIVIEGDYTVEETDLITGPLIGLPNSGSFRLLDIVGLDVWTNVGTNLYHAVPDDPWRDRFLMPKFHDELTSRGWLGEKSGQGYYKRVGKEKEIHAIDLHTFEYHPALKVKFPEADAVRAIEDLPERLRALVTGTGRVGTFLWKLYSDLFLYSAERVPEIADEIFQIDRAMRWGYANKLGPFELWDALGFQSVCKRLEADGRKLPENVRTMLSQGAESLYLWSFKAKQAHKKYFDFIDSDYKPFVERPSLIELKRAGNIVKSNTGASLIDLGDGVLCCEFHSKMNSLGEDQIGMIYSGLSELDKNFDAMVIANQGENFSVGANLMMVLLAAQEGEWDELNAAIQRFQQATMALKYAPKPVVAAPFSRALGGGCEIPIHCSRIQASAETYMGLVEVGVGLIPGAGGTKEMIVRFQGDARKAFELIAMAKVSSCAEDARALGFLTKEDRISMNADLLIDDAKQLALSLVRDYQPGVPRADVKVGGESAFAVLKIGAWSLRQAGYISDYDVVVAERLATVLCGGRLTGEQLVSEQYLLDLEREAFLSLCGQTKTQERMQAMLKTGKPLRN